MATDTAGTAASQPDTISATAADSKKPAGGRSLALIVLLVVSVMVVEAAVLHFLGLGHSSETSAEPETAKHDAEEVAEVEEELVEVEIDSFHVTNTLALAGAVVHVSFKLFAVVPKGREVEFEEAVNKEHKARVRQAIMEVARSASSEDMNDPSLQTFRRLIQEKMNKTLGRSYVVEAVVGDFTAMEQ